MSDRGKARIRSTTRERTLGLTVERGRFRYRSSDALTSRASPMMAASFGQEGNKVSSLMPHHPISSQYFGSNSTPSVAMAVRRSAPLSRQGCMLTLAFSRGINADQCLPRYLRQIYPASRASSLKSLVSPPLCAKVGDGSAYAAVSDERNLSRTSFGKGFRTKKYKDETQFITFQTSPLSRQDRPGLLVTPPGSHGSLPSLSEAGVNDRH